MLANKNNIRASGYIKLLMDVGKSVKEIAIILNKEDYLTARGKTLKAITVQRLYERNLKQNQAA